MLTGAGPFLCNWLKHMVMMLGGLALCSLLYPSSDVELYTSHLAPCILVALLGCSCRRMHHHVLETLFNPNTHAKQQHKQLVKQRSTNTSDANSSNADDQQHQQDTTAAAIAAVTAAHISPARLFSALYCGNLLDNGAFLERLNSRKGPNRKLVWVSNKCGASSQVCGKQSL